MPRANVSEKLAIKPRAITPGRRLGPLVMLTNSTKAPVPPALTTKLASSDECLTTSRTNVAALRAVCSSLSRSNTNARGNISPSTTNSANSIECLET